MEYSDVRSAIMPFRGFGAGGSSPVDASMGAVTFEFDPTGSEHREKGSVLSMNVVGAAKGTSENPDRKTRVFSSLRARLIVWTVEYVLLVQTVLFVILLAEFERIQLAQAAEEASVLAISQAWLEVGARTEKENLQLMATLDNLWKVSGVRPTRYRQRSDGAFTTSRTFTFSTTIHQDEVESIIDLEEYGMVLRFVTAIERLFRTGPNGLVIVNNPQTYLQDSGGSDRGSIEIISLALDAGRLREDTVYFIIIYLLQAAALTTAVSFLMYLAGGRQIATPLRKFRHTLARMADNPIRESADTSVQVGGIDELQEARDSLGKLKKSIREEGARAFLRYRGDVEHDVKDDLIMQNEIAKEIGTVPNALVREALIDRLTGMQVDTQDFLKNMFEFLTPERKNVRTVTVDLGNLCEELLGRNINLLMEDRPQGPAVVERLLCARARVDVPIDLKVTANEAALSSVLQNTIRNSVKAFRKSSSNQSDWVSKRLEIQAYKNLGGVVIVVRDNGPGFNSHLEYRKGTRRYKGRSWGIGLEVVRDRVQEMGGTFHISDNPTPPAGSESAGAEIRIELPRNAENQSTS